MICLGEEKTRRTEAGPTKGNPHHHRTRVFLRSTHVGGKV